jgi:hypothetical protein
VEKIGQRIIISYVIAGLAVDLWEGRQEIDALECCSLDTLPAAGRASSRAVDTKKRTWVKQLKSLILFVVPKAGLEPPGKAMISSDK